MAFLVGLYVHSVETDHADRMSLVSVLVAPRYIPQGTRLTPEMFEIRQVPKVYAPPYRVALSELLDERKRPLYENLRPLAEGEVLSSSSLCGLGISGGFSWLIPEGFVAFSLDLPPDKAAGGLISPGDSVDILATLDVEAGHRQKSRTMMLFRNVKVLGVGDRLIGGKKPDENKEREADLFKGTEGSNPPVTLALHPYEAAVVAYAREAGSIRLVLRPAGDQTTMPVKPVDMSSLP